MVAASLDFFPFFGLVCLPARSSHEGQESHLFESSQELFLYFYIIFPSLLCISLMGKFLLKNIWKNEKLHFFFDVSIGLKVRKEFYVRDML